MTLETRPRPFQLIDWQTADDEPNLAYLTIADAEGNEVSTITHRLVDGFTLDDDIAKSKIEIGNQIVDSLNETYPIKNNISPKSRARLNEIVKTVTKEIGWTNDRFGEITLTNSQVYNNSYGVEVSGFRKTDDPEIVEAIEVRYEAREARSYFIDADDAYDF